MDLNRVTLIGRLTKDPESKTTPSGQTVTTFSLATSYQWTDQNKQKQEKTEFHNIVAWRKLAEICAQYLTKGKQIYAEGRLQTRSWDDQSGVKKYKTEILLDNMIMLGGGQKKEGFTPTPRAAGEQPAPQEQSAGNASEEINVEEIPF